MALLKWKSEFSVGVPAVDHEHQELIELINELHDAIAEGDTSYAVPDFLGDIYTQIAAHFALEERIMRERGYDQYQDHKTDHERLLDEIRDIMDDYELHGTFDDATLAERLQAWFGGHFGSKDARLHKRLGV